MYSSTSFQTRKLALCKYNAPTPVPTVSTVFSLFANAEKRGFIDFVELAHRDMDLMKQFYDSVYERAIPGNLMVLSGSRVHYGNYRALLNHAWEWSAGSTVASGGLKGSVSACLEFRGWDYFQ